jgi:hypothetical protein
VTFQRDGKRAEGKPRPILTGAVTGAPMPHWLTPKASDGRAKGTGGKDASKGLALQMREMAMWPTATATDAAQSGAAGYSTASGRHSGTTLTDATVRMWPTPQTPSQGGRSVTDESQCGQVHLEEAVRLQGWNTPRARDWKGDGTNSLHRQVPRSTSGKRRARLNARWVAQLLGFPHDWLAPDGRRN